MLALPFLHGTCFPSLQRPLFLSHSPAPIHSFSPRCGSRPPYNLVLWTDSSVPFPFDNGGSGVLANCSLCGTETTLFFQQVQYAQVFLLKHAPLSNLFAGLGSFNKSATFLLFSYLILVLSSSSCSLLCLSCYLNLSGRNCLLSPPVLSGCNGSLDTCFFWETVQLMSWPDGECYSCQLQFLVVFFLLSLVSTHNFSLTGGILSHQIFFDTQVPSIFTEELVLPHHACCVLFCLCFNSLLLSSYLSRIGRIKNPSYSTCRHLSQDTTHVVRHCPATDS